MKTHPESVWIDTGDIAGAKKSDCTYSAAINTNDANALACDLEFVPAAAYIELKTRLEKAEYSANGFESLYDAAHTENESLKAQLQTQTENVDVLRNFAECVASAKQWQVSNQLNDAARVALERLK